VVDINSKTTPAASAWTTRNCGFLPGVPTGVADLFVELARAFRVVPPRLIVKSSSMIKAVIKQRENIGLSIYSYPGSCSFFERVSSKITKSRIGDFVIFR
jgi:hypothetical protein